MARRYLPFLVLLCSGCVTLYQPLVGLSRPSVINPELANFEGVHLLVRCIPGDYTDSGDSEVLCGNLKNLFTNQGAEVEVEVPDSDLPPDDEAKKPDLILELSSRMIHSENSSLVWALFYASFTLVPAVTDATFAQDIVVRDSDGFLLAQDSLQGRFIRYVGLFYWGVNSLMDLLVRPKEEQLTAGATKNDFSRDFYGQLSQTLFHGRMRQKVLNGFDEPGVVAPAAATGPTAPAQGRPKPAPQAAPKPGPAPAPAPQPAPPPKPIPIPPPKKNTPSKPDSDFTPFPGQSR